MNGHFDIARWGLTAGTLWTVFCSACVANRPPSPSPGTESVRATGTLDTGADALHVASERYDLVQMKRLLESGRFAADAKNAAGFTALQAAFLSLGRVFGHPANPRMAEVVEYLLAKGADPNLPFMYGGEPAYTVLHFAAYDGNMVLVPMLVKAGANPNARDSRGFSPLHSAARCDFRLSCDDCSRLTRSDFSVRWKQGAKPVIEYLVEHGADIHVQTLAGQSVLDVFKTPCTSDPDSCESGALASAKEWPTGMCKQAYAFVRRRLGE
jgi:ankyrin repeat protein